MPDKIGYTKNDGDNVKAQAAAPPARGWYGVVFLAWLVPGGGHFLLKRPGRGALLLASVAIMFLLGLMMRGTMFQPQTGDVLTTIIYCGGFVGDLASGLFYLLTVWLGMRSPTWPGTCMTMEPSSWWRPAC